MYSTYSKWIHVLIMLLALASMGQFIFSSSLLFLVSIILGKTSGYISTICGLISSLICLPTSFKIRSFYSDMRTHHYDMQSYYRYMLYISLTIQIICSLICCISLFRHDSVLKALTVGLIQYTTRPSDKKFVDVVQMLFQCCGIFTYQDWAIKRWVHVQRQQIFCGGQYSEMHLKSAYSPIANCKLNQLSGVPYSCCKADHMGACKNYDIKCSGVNTINKHGCLPKLSNFIVSILFSELSLYLIIIFTIIILLKLQSLEMSEINSNSSKEFKTIKPAPVPQIKPDHLETEIKNEKLDSAEIEPSSQKHLTEVTEPQKKSALELEATIYPNLSITSIPAVKKNSLYDSLDHLALKQTIKESHIPLQEPEPDPEPEPDIPPRLNTTLRKPTAPKKDKIFSITPKLYAPRTSSMPPMARMGTRFKQDMYPIKIEMLIPTSSSDTNEGSSESYEQIKTTKKVSFKEQ